MKKRQIINLAVALCLIMALGAGATLAFLTAQSQKVTNTFTVGKALNASAIVLDESKLQANGTLDPATRVLQNDYKNIQSGDVLNKDPMVTVKANTAACYMFVKITGLDALAAKGITVTDWNSNWVKADGNTSKDGIYSYKTGTSAVIPEAASDNKLPNLFTKLKVADTANLFSNGNPITLENIEIKACAVQAQNVTYDQAKGLAVFN